MNRIGYLVAAALIITGWAGAQVRKASVHQRGMLHQTVYNTGELGRAYDNGTAGVFAGFPSFEWPAYSAITVDSKPYSGQHNSFGGGVQIAANRRDTVTRLQAFCGGIQAITVAGIYSFPGPISRTENYPLLADGDLNPLYNPDEAEEIITASWGTPLGINVTRTSRAWSHPDYDDFIIYEYEFENTGDVDGNPVTPARSDTLLEVIISFSHGLAPGKTGYERTFNEWAGIDFQQKDAYGRFDRRRWLNYSTDCNGKPDLQYFTEWAQSGKNGGGLQSPQAAGYMSLYFDTTHLAHQNETKVIVTSAQLPYVWDANNHLKQPFLNRVETSNMTTAKNILNLDIAQARNNAPYTNPAYFGPDWTGRGAFNIRQSWQNVVGRTYAFGPYILPPGHKIRFAMADVAGYGPASLSETLAGVYDEGGSCGSICNQSASSGAFVPVFNYSQTMANPGDGRIVGSTYLSNYPLPQYVNSKVVTIRDVADRAIQAYTNNGLVDYDSSYYWPEKVADRGVYKIPIVVPAPVIMTENTSLAANRIRWKNQVESFAAPRLSAPFSHYKLYKADHPLGPWVLLDSIGKADPRFFRDSLYTVLDPNTRIGESYYYSVISVDSLGNRSGRTNMTLHKTQLGGTDKLEPNIFAVPNPFVVRSGYSGAGNTNDRIGFYNLPKKCTIKIISYAGQLVETIEHDSGYYSTEYLQVTRNNQIIASGVYFFVVETPDGSRSHGKFVVIK